MPTGALDQPVNVFSQAPLLPLWKHHGIPQIPINLGPSQTGLLAGRTMGQVASSQNDVQTLTIGSGTPSSGSVVYAGTNPVSGAAVAFTIPYNATSSSAQTLIDAAFGAGMVVVTGGPFPGTGLILTFSGGGAALATVPVITLVSNTLNTGTPAVAHTTVGRTAGTWYPYDGTLAAPAGAPTVTGNGSGSGFAAGSVGVCYTLVSAYGSTPGATGESLPSPVTFATLTAGQNARVSAITSLNAAITAVNYYVNGTFAAQTAVSGGTAAQTDLTGSTIATGQVPPRASDAFTAPNGAGTHIARGFLGVPCSTDNLGNITYGGAAGGGPWGETHATAPLYTTGTYDPTVLSGLDANAVKQMFGRFISGSLANGGEFRVP